MLYGIDAVDLKNGSVNTRDLHMPLVSKWSEITRSLDCAQHSNRAGVQDASPGVIVDLTSNKEEASHRRNRNGNIREIALPILFSEFLAQLTGRLTGCADYIEIGQNDVPLRIYFLIVDFHFFKSP